MEDLFSSWKNFGKKRRVELKYSKFEYDSNIKYVDKYEDDYFVDDTIDFSLMDPKKYIEELMIGTKANIPYYILESYEILSQTNMISFEENVKILNIGTSFSNKEAKIREYEGIDEYQSIRKRMNKLNTKMYKLGLSYGKRYHKNKSFNNGIKYDFVKNTYMSFINIDKIKISVLEKEGKRISGVAYNIYHNFNNLKNGGNSIILCGSTLLPASRQLMKYYVSYFEKVYLFFHMIEHPRLPQMFLCGKNFKGISKEELDKFYSLCNSFVDNKNPYSLFENYKEDEFDKIILDYNDLKLKRRRVCEKIISDTNKNESNKNKIKKLMSDFIFEYAVEYQIPIHPKNNKHLKNIFESYMVKDKSGQSHKFHSNIHQKYGEFMYELVRDNKFDKTLEVGMAYGTSAMYLCQGIALFNGKHISLDPFQSTQWKGIGKFNVEQSGLDRYFRLIEQPSYLGLPQVLTELITNLKVSGWNSKEFKESKDKYGLVFIDGWHTFDYTLVDFFYSDLLLNVGGYIIIDDVKFDAVKELTYYLDSNFKHYERINRPDLRLFAIYKKIRNDDRNWNFHVNITEKMSRNRKNMSFKKYNKYNRKNKKY